MRTKHILWILTITLLTYGCKKTIQFKGDIIEPKLVVSCFITPDSVIKAQVTKSRFFMDKDNHFERITNATFKLFVNGTVKEQLMHLGEGIYQSNYQPSINDKIKIEVSASGLTTVSSIVYFPKRPQVLSVDTSSTMEYTYADNYQEGEEGVTPTMEKSIHKKINFQVKFKDDGSQKDYYRLVVRKQTLGNGIIQNEYLTYFEDIIFGNKKNDENPFTEIDIIDFSSSNDYGLFSDDLINGKEYTIKFSNGSPFELPEVGSNNSEKNELRVIYYIYLQQISRDYYLYVKSANMSQSYNENPFAEPVQIHSNIENGIGIFGSYTSSPVYMINMKIN